MIDREPLSYKTGTPKGFLHNDKRHPMNVEVEVLPRRTFNGPDGSHAGPGSRLWRAECEIEPNRDIFLPVTSPEYAEMRKKEEAKEAEAEAGPRRRGRPAKAAKE